MLLIPTNISYIAMSKNCLSIHLPVVPLPPFPPVKGGLELEGNPRCIGAVIIKKIDSIKVKDR